MAIISQNAIKHGFLSRLARISGEWRADIRRPENQDAGNQESGESGRIALITRYPDAQYKLCKTKPISKSQKKKACQELFAGLGGRKD